QGFTATGTWTPSTNYRFVTLTIGNEGTADAGRFLVQYSGSDDPEITAADALVGASVVQSVPEGTSVDVNETIDLSGVFGADDPLRTDNEYFLGAIVNTDPRRGVVEAHTYNNSNRGLGVDSIKISSEADLPIPANGTVIARPIPASRFGESRISELGDEYIGAYDMDVWSFPITEPGIRARLYVRGQGTFQSSPLADPYLRLYDENWTPLAANDNGVPPDAPAGSPIGSYIEEVF